VRFLAVFWYGRKTHSVSASFKSTVPALIWKTIHWRVNEKIFVSIQLWTRGGQYPHSFSRDQLVQLTLHLKTRPNFSQLHILMTCLDENMVIVVREGHHPLGILLGHREQVLQDIRCPLSQLARKVVKDQVRECFRDCAVVLDIMSQDHIVQCEERRWSMREVRNNHAVGLSTVLVQDDQIRDIVCFAGIDNLLHDVSSTVDTLRVGEDKTHLLGKLLQTTAWVTRSCNEHLGVVDTGTCVFIVNVAGGVCWIQSVWLSRVDFAKEDLITLENTTQMTETKLKQYVVLLLVLTSLSLIVLQILGELCAFVSHLSGDRLAGYEPIRYMKDRGDQYPRSVFRYWLTLQKNQEAICMQKGLPLFDLKL
jgi:hypothetical protein